MEGLDLAIPQYDPKRFLSQVSIFGKRKLEELKTESKYGVIDSKKVKLEPKEEDQVDVEAKLAKNVT